MAEGFAPWCCPLCGAPLAGDNALKCPSGHSFDRGKEGYWHLLPVQNTRTKAPGDSREMVAARRAFLSADYYGIFGRRWENSASSTVSRKPESRSICWTQAAARLV